MNFKTSAKTIKDYLSKVLKVVVEKEDVPPILTNIFLSLDGNALTLMSSDLTNNIACTFTVKGKTNGEACLPAKLLNQIVSSFDKDINIEMNDGNVSLKSDKTEFIIPTEDTDAFPRSFNLEDMQNVVLSDANIRDMKRVIHSISDNFEKHPHFCGLNIAFSKEYAIYTATDEVCLSRVTDVLTAGQEIEKDASLLITDKFARLLVDFCGKDKSLTLSWNKEYVQADLGNILVISKIIQEVFPKVEHVIPTEFRAEIQAKHEELKKAVRRAGFINKKELQFDFAEKTVLIKAINSETGYDYSQQLPYTTTAKAIPALFSINTTDLLTALEEVSAEKEMVTLKVAGKMVVVAGNSKHIEIIMFRKAKTDAKKKKAEKPAETTAPEVNTADTPALAPKEKKQKKTAPKKAA